MQETSYSLFPRVKKLDGDGGDGGVGVQADKTKLINFFIDLKNPASI